MAIVEMEADSLSGESQPGEEAPAQRVSGAQQGLRSRAVSEESHGTSSVQSAHLLQPAPWTQRGASRLLKFCVCCQASALGQTLGQQNSKKLRKCWTWGAANDFLARKGLGHTVNHEWLEPSSVCRGDSNESKAGSHRQPH